MGRSLPESLKTTKHRKSRPVEGPLKAFFLSNTGGTARASGARSESSAQRLSVAGLAWETKCAFIVASCSKDALSPPTTSPFKGPSMGPFPRFVFIICRLSWETLTQDNLTPDASDRPETRLELLTRISSIRFVPLSATSSQFL